VARAAPRQHEPIACGSPDWIDSGPDHPVTGSYTP
jgi:hypothetical protein